jgi:hypothetical protein
VTATSVANSTSTAGSSTPAPVTTSQS